MDESIILQEGRSKLEIWFYSMVGTRSYNKRSRRLTQGAKISPPPCFFCRRETRYLFFGGRSAWSYIFETIIPKSNILIMPLKRLGLILIPFCLLLTFQWLLTLYSQPQKYFWKFRGIFDKFSTKNKIQFIGGYGGEATRKKWHFRCIFDNCSIKNIYLTLESGSSRK